MRVPHAPVRPAMSHAPIDPPWTADIPPLAAHSGTMMFLGISQSGPTRFLSLCNLVDVPHSPLFRLTTSLHAHITVYILPRMRSLHPAHSLGAYIMCFHLISICAAALCALLTLTS